MLNRNFAIALAVAMVLAALYGCSSNNTGIKNDLSDAEEQVTMLQGDLDTANADIMGLEGEVATETGRADGLQTDLDNANTEVMRIQGDLDTATARVTELAGMLAMATGNAGDLKTALDNATARVTELAGMLAMATGNAGDLKTKLDNATARITTATARITKLESDIVAMTTAAGKDAYPMERAVAKAIGPGAMEPDRADMVSVDGYAASFTAKVEDLEAISDVLDVGDWAKSALGDDTNAVVLYSNVAAPGDEEYLDYYDTPDAAGPGRGSVGSQSGGVLEFGTDVASGDAALFDAAGAFPNGFPSGDRQVFTWVDDDDTTEANQNEGHPEFGGHFHGVPGEFACTGTCTATADKDGNLSALGGTWTFTPTELEDDADPYKVRGVTPDDEYVVFGFWKEVDEDGNATGVTAIWQGGDQVTNTAMNDIVGGDVSYSGDATGKYVRKTLTPDGQVSTLAGGQFTADVELTAHFGGLDVAENKKFEVDGTMTNFMDGADNIDSNWSVKLDTASITHPTNNSDDSTFMGPTKAQGLVAGADGNWNGAFFGTTVIADDLDTDVTESGFTQPTYAAGQFDAHFLNGHVRGAFGAEQD